jgi:hypothetical protein
VSGPASRRRCWVRAILAFGAVAAIVLLAVTAVLLGGDLAAEVPTHGTEVHDAGTVLVAGDADHAPPAVHALRQQPSTRARTAAFAVLAAAVVVAVGVGARVRMLRSGGPRRAAVIGRPPGRAPPLLRIA